MNKEEEFKNSATYLGWSFGERNTFQGLLEAYRRKRIQVGPFVYITRNMLKDAYGTKHVGTASKYQGYIEEIEGDQPPCRRPAAASRQTDSSAPPPAAIQTAFDGVRKALDAALNAVLELRTAEGSELAATYERLQREYLAAADAREQALSARITGLEADSTDTGKESCDLAARVEELRAAFEAAASERDAEKVRADEATTAHDLALAQLAAAKAEVQTAEVRLGVQAEDIRRLTQERDELAAAATHAAEIGFENCALQERASGLAERVASLESLVAEMGARHAQERDAMRAAYEAALAEERRQRFGWLGVPVAGNGEGERG